MTTTPKEPRPNVLGASTLSGNSVRNLAGETLGTIEEFMIDLETGKVAYCVLSFENGPGTGEKLFAVPFGAMTLDTRDHAFTLDIARERLAGAPGFDKADWPDVTERSWEERVFGFYDVQPYWM